MMQNYPIHAVGLLITEDEYKPLVVKIKEKAAASEISTDEFDDTDISITQENDIFPISHDILTFQEIEHPSFTDLNGNSHEVSEDFIVIDAFRYPRIVGTAYQSKEEIVQEFKNDLNEYFSADFDWEAHIGEIIGVNYG